MYFNRKVSGFLRAVAQAHGRNHVAFSGYAYAGTTAKSAFMFDFFPQMIFSEFYFIVLRVALYLFHYEIDLLKFHVDNVVHDALCQSHMLAEQFEIEASLICKRIYNVRI